MATVKASTGFRNALVSQGDVKSLLNDYVLVIYSGTPPATADSAETGSKLATVTLGGNTWSQSVAQVSSFSITAIGDNNDTITITITPTSPSGTAESFVYTKTSSESTVSDIVKAICNLLSTSKIVIAVPSLNTTEKSVILKAKYAGDAHTVNIAKTGNIGVSPTGDLTPFVSNTRGNGLHFELTQNVSGGVLEKVPTDVWQGTVIASGTAQWFRIQANNDSGGSSTTAIRIQGTAGTLTDNALQLAGTAYLTAGVAITIDTFEISLPA